MRLLPALSLLLLSKTVFAGEFIYSCSYTLCCGGANTAIVLIRDSAKMNIELLSYQAFMPNSVVDKKPIHFCGPESPEAAFPDLTVNHNNSDVANYFGSWIFSHKLKNGSNVRQSREFGGFEGMVLALPKQCFSGALKATGRVERQDISCERVKFNSTGSQNAHVEKLKKLGCGAQVLNR
jgi:hypothetical protein